MRALPTIRHLALATATTLAVAAAPARADDRPVPRAAPPRPAVPPTREATPALTGLPLPSPSGKPLASVPGQRSFRVPLGFSRVERFYREQLGSSPGITLTVERRPEGRLLTLTSQRDHDTWSKAVAREGAVDTTIDVTPFWRAGPVIVEARAPQPLVHFVMPASPEVARQANSIDHFEAPRK